MTDQNALSRLRAITAVLPDVEETAREDGQTTFLVAGRPFMTINDGPDAGGDMIVRVRTTDTDAQSDVSGAQPANVGSPESAEAGWVALPLGGDIDWTLVEDRVARSWELTAPDGLLEAGGR